MEPSAASKPSRTVLLASRPLDPLIDSALFALGTRRQLANNCISWSHFQPPPSLSENIYFATHLAVGVIETDTWEDTSQPWAEKFQHVYWWEHLGAISGSGSSGAMGGAGRTWQEQEIATIQAVEILGTTSRTNEEITLDVYSRLFPDWVYLPIWWNCQDFAVRLAFLLVQTPWATERLASIARQLKEDVVVQILTNWRRREGILMAHVASFPALFAPGALLYTSPYILMSVIWHSTDLWLRGADPVGVRKWLRSIVRLGNAVEELRTFHREIFREWNTQIITFASGMQMGLFLEEFGLSEATS